MITISVANNKGGVSKTTTAINMAAIMAERGERVLLIDMDSQGSATNSYSIFPNQYEICIAHLLLDQIMIMLKNKPTYQVKDAIIKTQYGVDVIPCDGRVSEIATWLQDNGEHFTGKDIMLYWKNHFPWFLKNIISVLESSYDRVIIDTPPTFAYDLKASLLASDYIIVPVELGRHEIRALESLNIRIDHLKNEYKSNASLLGVVVNRYEGGLKGARTVVEKSLEKQLRNHRVFSGLVFENVIYKSTVIKEAAALGMLSISHTKKRVRSVKENFLDFVEEVELWLAKRGMKTHSK